MNPNSGWFWFGCVPLRLAMAWLLPDSLLIALPLMLAFVMMMLWLLHARQHAFEGGNQTWWAPYRILHALIFLCASGSAFVGNFRLARCLLTLDVATGSWLWIQQKKTESI